MLFPALVRRAALVAAVLGTATLSLSLAPAFAEDAAASSAAPVESSAADASSEPAADATVADIDPAAIERGFKVWKGSDCAGCHGWAGNGEKIGENPPGPNLRALDLDAATLKEIILCGRPSTKMPSHDTKAYLDDRCYGLTKADLGMDTPITGKPMTADQADDIVAFIRGDLYGKPERPTLEECQRYYGKKPLCNVYAQ